MLKKLLEELKQRESRSLSERDSIIFWTVCESERRPNRALRAAAAKWKWCKRRELFAYWAFRLLHAVRRVFRKTPLRERL